MAQTTPNLGLKVWNSSTDPYNYTELANNFISIDRHDHSPGNGALIDGANGIKPGSIGASQLGPNSVSSGNIVDGSIGASEIADGVITASKITTSTGSRITAQNIEDGTLTIGKFGFTPGQLNTYLPTAIPSSNLTDGQTIYVTDKTGAGETPTYFWQLRYSTLTTNWHFSGGTPIYVTNASSFNSSSTSGTYADGISTSLPLYGTYLVQQSVTAYYNTDATVYAFASRLFIGSSGQADSTANATLANNSAGTGSQAATATNTSKVICTSETGKTLKIGINRLEGAGSLISSAGNEKLLITPISIPSNQT